MHMIGAPSESSSLLLQLLLYCSCGWCVVWLVVTQALLIYKGMFLHSSPMVLPIEAAASFLLLVLQICTLFLGKRGNLLCEVQATCLAVLMSLVLVSGAAYYTWLQTYVTTLDFSISFALLAFDALTALAGVYSTFGFIRAGRRQRRVLSSPTLGTSTIVDRGSARGKGE
uniref:Transmembrane protein n=1 Tax=Trypanosoma congolense (strain IL3000) TaxID=1068625 RepID=G0ULH1_TRYCI|nr:conserved hypothetical protein [Trypanosoma congolense IL3000]